MRVLNRIWEKKGHEEIPHRWVRLVQKFGKKKRGVRDLEGKLELLALLPVASGSVAAKGKVVCVREGLGRTQT